MEIRKNTPKRSFTEQPLIALHKVIVTVRQILSADPAVKDRAIFQNFGGTPFPLQRLHDLAKEY
jgi:hypothetical protein